MIIFLINNVLNRNEENLLISFLLLVSFLTIVNTRFIMNTKKTSKTVNLCTSSIFFHFLGKRDFDNIVSREHKKLVNKQVFNSH